jgi:hypothetical protein
VGKASTRLDNIGNTGGGTVRATVGMLARQEFRVSIPRRRGSFL